MSITRTQAESLATFIAKMRPDWDHPGIVAAIGKAQSQATALQIARALVNLAENRELHTPALLPEKGNHWRDASEAIGPNASHNVHCIEHPLSVMPCPQCAAKRTPPPVDDPDYAAMKAELKARRPIPTEQKRLADFVKEATS